MANVNGLLFLFVFSNLLHLVFLRAKLYPYGNESKDTSVKDEDDGGSRIEPLSLSFPFFDEARSTLRVLTNGAISFHEGSPKFLSLKFPGDKRSLIVPFWADVHTGNGGSIYYRTSLAPDILKNVSQDIQRFFVRHRNFMARWVFIATWSNVPSVGDPSHITNTFQTILATDGVYAFSIFLYNHIGWTKRPNSDHLHAQAGFNAGDGNRSFSIPNSGTPAIINITLTSNYNISGFWLFQVDGETIENNGCGLSTNLVLSPRSGIQLGGTKVFLGGPCFSPTNNIICRFNKTLQTTAKYISQYAAFCITPPLYVAGRIPVELSLDGGITYTFNGNFRSIPIGRNSPDVKGLEVKNWASLTKTNLTWNKKIFDALRLDIELFIFNSSKFVLHQDALASFKNVSNNGSYELVFNISSERNPVSSIGIVRISASYNKNESARLFSSLFLLPYAANETYCRQWHALLNMNKTRNLQEEVTPCPTSLQQITADQRFMEDSSAKRQLTNISYPYNTFCFRSRVPSPSGGGQQCCYSTKGSLIVGPPWGGTMNFASPEINLWNHFKEDVLPWFACCKTSIFHCAKYYQRRPSDNGKRYRPLLFGATRGDPHFTTFNGKKFTFNGHGEYTLLQINNGTDIKFQGRMTPLMKGLKETKATALKAFALKNVESDAVQVEFNKGKSFAVYVNNERVEFDEQKRLDFKNVVLIRHNRAKIGVYFTSGVSVNAQSFEDFLSCQVSVPKKFEDKLIGLLGNLAVAKLPNGDFDNKQIHKDFNYMWKVNKSKSLFNYRYGKSYDTFTDDNFEPYFLNETNHLLSMNETLKNETTRICQQNKECLFDAAVTGNTAIGLNTLQSFTELEKTINNSKLASVPLYFGCDGIQNSTNKTDYCGVCGGDNSTCVNCQGVAQPGFIVTGLCNSYKQWSKWSACFWRYGNATRQRKRDCSIREQCRHPNGEYQYKACKSDQKDWEFYLIVVGIPVLVILFFAATIALCYRYNGERKHKDSSVYMSSSYVNSAHSVGKL